MKVPAVDFVLVIDKPPGPTSHDVVAVVRRAIGVKRIGHTGTLDPLATGVLALVVGKTTRLAAYLSGTEKEYVARVRFGATTATYDAEAARETAPSTGMQVPRTETEVARALPGFLGTYLQQPPPFSAKKIAGTPAYTLARQQKPVEIKPARVTVRELELRGYAGGLAELRIVCSSGFYVRSFAHDLGQRLGCGAFLEALQRTRSGDFTLEDAVPLATVIADPIAATARAVPMHRLLPELPAVVLTDEGVRRTGHGSALRDGDFTPSTPAFVPPLGGEPGTPPPVRVRLLDGRGALLGLAEAREPRTLHPVLVLV